MSHQLEHLTAANLQTQENLLADVPLTAQAIEAATSTFHQEPNPHPVKMDIADIPALLSRLQSDEDAMRKMAVFKLQSSINDPSFADHFIVSGGLNILRRLIMTTGGNTLAYSLQSLSRLLEVDMGWEMFEQQPGARELVDRLVELIVTHPLVNILRGAMSILVAIVSYPQSQGNKIYDANNFGYRALKPAMANYGQFYEMVVSQLNSADHALCANALMLLNALMRDAIINDVPLQKEKEREREREKEKGGNGSLGKTQKELKDMESANGSAEEWPRLIKKLQDLGVIQAVYILMQSSALQDLAHPLLEFQAVTKVLLRKWREVRVNMEIPDQRRAMKALHAMSAPEKKDITHSQAGSNTRAEEVGSGGGSARKGSKKHSPEKWRRLGFETETPAWEFENTGFLGMMDLTDYVRKHEDEFQKIILEQASKPMHERCPIARASIAVTLILYEQFEVEKADVEDAKSYLILDGLRNYDQIFRPLLLQWSRLHTASLHAFFRLWKITCAEQDDFFKIAELVRILIGQVVGHATRTKDIHDIEEELAEFEYSRLRELQIEVLNKTFEHRWGRHLMDVRTELHNEAMQFVKEQRVRCMLEGAWFPRNTSNSDGEVVTSWRFLRLSHNRRYIHYDNFPQELDHAPTLEQLGEKIDLNDISSVSSNITAVDEKVRGNINGHGNGSTKGHSKFRIEPSETESISSNSTIKTPPSQRNNRHHNANGNNNNNQQRHVVKKQTTTNIIIHTYKKDSPPRQKPSSSNQNHPDENEDRLKLEEPLLKLSPQSNSVASEWLDGLLLLLHQLPITTETNKMVELVENFGLKVRLLNVRVGGEGEGEGEREREVEFTGFGSGAAYSGKRGEIPSREGLDEDYYYSDLV